VLVRVCAHLVEGRAQIDVGLLDHVEQHLVQTDGLNVDQVRLEQNWDGGRETQIKSISSDFQSVA